MNMKEMMEMTSEKIVAVKAAATVRRTLLDTMYPTKADRLEACAYKACQEWQDDYFNEGSAPSCKDCGKFFPQKVEMINLTPHAITAGGAIIQPSGVVARCKTAEEDKYLCTLNGIEVRRTFKMEGTIDLPSEKDFVFLIVSRLVAEANPSRKDLLFPGGLIRDSEGRIMGCEALLQF